MRVRVNFKVNRETGEVEEFLVEDISTEPEDEHDAAHDRIAVEIGKVVERRPAPAQVIGGTAGDATPLTYHPGEDLVAPLDEGEKAQE
jgi:hypothetical protein